LINKQANFHSPHNNPKTTQPRHLKTTELSTPYDTPNLTYFSIALSNDTISFADITYKCIRQAAKATNLIKPLIQAKHYICIM